MGFDPEPDEFPAADLTCQADVGLLVLLGCANMSIARLDYRWFPVVTHFTNFMTSLGPGNLVADIDINGLHLAILLY